MAKRLEIQVNDNKSNCQVGNKKPIKQINIS